MSDLDADMGVRPTRPGKRIGKTLLCLFAIFCSLFVMLPIAYMTWEAIVKNEPGVTLVVLLMLVPFTFGATPLLFMLWLFGTEATNTAYINKYVFHALVVPGLLAFPAVFVFFVMNLK